jgi:hypothetical protein
MFSRITNKSLPCITVGRDSAAHPYNFGGQIITSRYQELQMFRFGADDILRVINEKVNPSSLNERRYDLAELRFLQETDNLI